MQYSYDISVLWGGKSTTREGVLGSAREVTIDGWISRAVRRLAVCYALCSVPLPPSHLACPSRPSCPPFFSFPCSSGHQLCLVLLSTWYIIPWYLVPGTPEYYTSY